MDLKQLNPWNWLNHEEGERRERERNEHSLAPSPMMQSPIMRLHQDINRLFDEAFKGFGTLPTGWDTSFFSEQTNLLKPNINIESDSKNYTISLEVPGVDEDAVELEVSNDTLVIKGEKKQEKEDKNKEYHRMERTYGKFQRVLSLPEDASQDDIKADFKNGVLTINIPRKEVAKTNVRHIDIKKAS
ncbi:Hsp20/alpha crystallin family protein [Alkalimarinus coralli]|uniref:Hsp20/alpha crystallin family protein n=1 Tax=Alkalimarinus coralli TaxID=2935863 RepID=UPI00202B3A4D|nr:Hsp20/alpha crystallin family protein [Alkalimarinus coralli]